MSHIAVQSILDVLAQHSADDVVWWDAREQTLSDYVIVASGRSHRHVLALAQHLVQYVKSCGVQPRGVEGQATAEWILIDLDDILVHIMQAPMRALYQLEPPQGVLGGKKRPAVNPSMEA